MKKGKRNILKITLLSLAFVLVFLISTLYMPFIRKSKNVNAEFEYVFKDVIPSMDTKIIDIAMLGAHDAFSSDIKFSSKPNKNEEGISNNKLVNAVAKGLCVRMSKAQVASAKEMLYAGVRYFDVRVTKIGDTYYTYHGYLSNKLEVYVKDIVEFLSSHPGEFIIFDIQYFYTEEGACGNLGKEVYQELFDYLDTLGLMQYVVGDTSKEINTLTYGDLTSQGMKAGVLMMTKSWSFDTVYYRDKDASYEKMYYESTFSYWHEKNKTSDMLKSINELNSYIEENDTLKQYLRINQAQKTGFIMSGAIVRSLFGWSLINMANNFNKVLVSDEARFKEWLVNMPIFMVDYVTSNKGDFNKLANKYIMEFNKNL